MIYIYIKVRKKQLAEKESMLWMIGGVLIVIISLFPKGIDYISKLVNIDYPPSLLFLLGIVFCLGLILRITVYVSVLKEQVKELAQVNAILQKEVYELKERV